MGTAGSPSLVAWIGGRDFTGRGALTTLEEQLEAMTAPEKLLGPPGAIDGEAPTGVSKYTLREGGHLRGKAHSLRLLLGDTPPAPPFVSVVAPIGGTVGAFCHIASALRIRKNAIVPALDDFATIDLELYLDDGGSVYDDGKIVHGGTRIVAEDSNDPPYDGYRLDLGAGGAPNGIAIALQLDDSVHWRGRTRLRLNIQQNANETPNGWMGMGGTVGLLDVNPIDKRPAAQLFAITGAVERYVALRWRWDGATALAIDNAGGYQAGDRELHLDGRAGTEGVFVGDQLTIGGATYRITAGGTPIPAADEFDVTLDRGLDAAVADNAAVSVPHTEASFKALAAIQIL